MSRASLLGAIPLLLAGLSLMGCPVYGERQQVITGEVDCSDGAKRTQAGELPSSCNCGDKDVPRVGEPLPGVDVDSVPRRGGLLRTHIDANLPSLNYLTHSDAWIHRLVVHHVYQALIRQDPRDYSYRGELATGWEHNEDGTEWTFTLRDGVKWHDGEDFTVEDVVFTFDTIMNPQNRTEAIRSGLQDIFAPINAYEALDDSHFIIRLKKPVFTFLQDMNNVTIIPKHIFERGDFNSHPNLRAPIGTGPYEFVDWTSEEIIFKRHDNFWGRPPYLDELRFRVVTDRETAFLMLKRGDIDFMTRIQPHHRTEGYTEDVAANFNLTEHIPSQYAFWIYNTTLPVFADARARRAMSYIMPVDRVICEIYQCQGARTTGPLPQTHPAYDTSIEPYPYDLDKAMALLEEAGWSDSDGDGVRDKMIDGVKTPFTFTFLLTSSSRTLEQQLTVVQSAARRAGVEIKLSKVDWSVFVERLRKHEFEAASLLWILSHETDPYNLFHSEGGQNYGKWHNEEADKIMKAANRVLDDTVRNVLYRRLHHIIHEEQPYTFIYTPVLPGLISKRFAGVYTSDDFYQWEDIWLMDDTLPEVPPEDRHPGNTGALPYDDTGR